jgi:protein SCO1/2
MRLIGLHLLGLTAILAIAPISSAQYAKPPVGSLNKPLELYQPDEVGVDEKPGNQVPLDAQFKDEEGQPIAVSALLKPHRPTILWLGYYECPMLCDKMSAGMVKSLKNIQLEAGGEFVVTQISINPSEVPADAKAKKETYLKQLGRPGDASGWNLLTGTPTEIARVADAVGYKFKKVTVDGETQYAHPAVLMILSPEGKVTRYLYPKAAEGVEFDSRTMQLSLIEASNGQVGSTVDRILLTCLHYDPTTGRYTWVAVNLMKLGAAVTVVIMAALLIPFWLKSPRNLFKWTGETRDSKTIHQF